MEIYKLYTDGCHYSQIDRAGIGGYLLNEKSEKVFEFSKSITEFQKKHELMALIHGLEQCLEANVHQKKLLCFNDESSISFIAHVKGEVARQSYVESNPLWSKVYELIDQFSDISFIHIPREANKIADKLSRKMIVENVFKDNQLRSDGFSHPHFNSKNNFPAGSRVFSELKKSVNDFLVVHTYPIKNKVHMDMYKARVHENETVSHTLVNQFVTQKDWTTFCINQLTIALDNPQNLKIGLVIQDHFLILDEILRGRHEISRKNVEPLKLLAQVCDKYEKIVVHQNPNIMAHLFPD